MNTKVKLSLKVLSLILTVLLLFQFSSLTLYTLAEELGGWGRDTAGTADAGDILSVAYEIEERRDASVKHFRLTDGSVLAVDYGTAIHYPTADGRYEEYKNTLTAAGADYSTADARIRFSKKITGNERLFTLHNHNAKFDLSLTGARKKTTAQISTLPTEEGVGEIGRLTALDQAASRVYYADILPGVDVEYILFGDMVKENILVKQRGGPYTYDFTLSLNNLTPQMRDGAILLQNAAGETVYAFPAPYMTDARGVYSPEVSYTLTDGGNGKWGLSVVASPAFMDDPATVYPVTIDPSVEGTLPRQMMRVDSNYPDQAGTPCTGEFQLNEDQRVYLDFDLSFIPSGSWISSAKLAMYYGFQAFPADVRVYDVPNAWSMTDTWRTMQNNIGSLLDTQTLVSNEVYYWDILPAVAEEHRGIAGHHGIAVVVDGIQYFPGLADYNPYYMRPRLEVTYRDMRGVEDYYPLYTQNAGSAGSFAVNLATGNLTMALPLLALNNQVLPMSAGLYTDGKDRAARLNLCRTVTSVSYVDKNGTTNLIYCYTDADGTSHYFLPTTTSGVYADEDGLLLTMTFADGSTDILITDDGGNRMRFSDIASLGNLWYLISYEDEDGNRLTVSYTNEQPTELAFIPRGQNVGYDKITVTYDEAWRPVTLTGSRGDTVTLTYNAAGQPLTLCRTLDGVVLARAAWEYDSAGRLTRAIHKSPDGTQTLSAIGYTYGVGGVTAVTEYGKDMTAGQSVWISYHTRSTDVRSSGKDDVIGNDDDLITRHLFDTAGRTVGTYGVLADGSEVYSGVSGKYTEPELDGIRSNNRIKEILNYETDNDSYLINGGFENDSIGWTLSGNSTVSSDYYEGYHGFSCLDLGDALTAENQGTATQQVALTPGTYTLSLYISGNNGTETYPEAFVRGTVDIAVKTLTERQEGSFRYVQNTMTFTVETAGVYTVGFRVRGSRSGTKTSHYYIDDVTLVRGSIAATWDLVEYGGFDVFRAPDAYGLTHYWQGGGSYVTGGMYGNALSLSAPGAGDEVSVSQVVYIPPEWLIENRGTEDESPVFDRVFLLAGYVKLDPTVAAYGGVAKITLRCEYLRYDDTTVTEDTEITFDTRTAGWQYLAQPVTVSTSDGALHPDRLLTGMTLILTASRGVGTVLFDGISLVENPQKYIAADYQDGRLTHSQEGYANHTYYFYDSLGRLTQTADSFGNVRQMRYRDDTHKMWYEDTGIFTPSDWTDRTVPVASFDSQHDTVYIYDSTTGFLKETYTTSYAYDTSNEGITTTTTYVTDVTSSHYGAVLSYTDGEGYTTSHTYDGKFRLVSSRGSDGRGTYYFYNAQGEIQTVVPTVTGGSQAVADLTSASASYTYDPVSGRLTAVTTATVTYTFRYDIYGNTSAILADGETLVSYTVSAGNGKVTDVTYGNGDTVHYDYDALDRVSSVWYNGVETTRYTYGKEGDLVGVEDVVLGREESFAYDGYGSLTQYVSSVRTADGTRRVIDYMRATSTPPTVG